MTDICVVDTNVLVYFIDSTDSEKHAKAREFFRKVNKAPENYVICLQSIRELAAVARKKGIGGAKVNEFFSLLGDFFGTIIYDNETDAINAFNSVGRNDYWDALIAQTALRHGISSIYTENVSDFAKLEGISATNPFR